MKRLANPVAKSAKPKNIFFSCLRSMLLMYRNQSTDLHLKPANWFLYDRSICLKLFTKATSGVPINATISQKTTKSTRKTSNIPNNK